MSESMLSQFFACSSRGGCSATVLFFRIILPTSSCEVLRSKLLDGKCLVQPSVALVDLAVRSFPWFSPKIAEVRARIA